MFIYFSSPIVRLVLIAKTFRNLYHSLLLIPEPTGPIERESWPLEGLAAPIRSVCIVVS